MPLWARELRRQYRREHGRFSLGKIVVTQPGYEPEVVYNRLFNQGELLVVRQVYRNEAVLPVSFFGRLYNDVPTDTDLLADLTGEPSGNGYAALSWTRNTTDFGTAAIVAGAGQSIGLKKTFTGTGAGYGPVTVFVLATSSDGSGVPYSWFTLAQARTITPAAPLDVQPYGIFRGETT